MEHVLSFIGENYDPVIAEQLNSALDLIDEYGQELDTVYLDTLVMTQSNRSIQDIRDGVYTEIRDTLIELVESHSIIFNDDTTPNLDTLLDLLTALKSLETTEEHLAVTNILFDEDQSEVEKIVEIVELLTGSDRSIELLSSIDVVSPRLILAIVELFKNKDTSTADSVEFDVATATRRLFKLYYNKNFNINFFTLVTDGLLLGLNSEFYTKYLKPFDTDIGDEIAHSLVAIAIISKDTGSDKMEYINTTLLGFGLEQEVYQAILKMARELLFAIDNDVIAVPRSIQ